MLLDFVGSKLSNISSDPVKPSYSIEVSVCRYGADDITSRDHYNEFYSAVLQPAEVDKAGAASNRIVEDFMGALQERHRQYLSASHIGWRIWAAWISAMNNPLEQNAAVEAVPPPHIVQHFRSVPTEEAQILQASRRANDVGLVLLDIMEKDILKVKESVKRTFDFVFNQLESLNETIARERRLVRGFQTSLHAQETENSRDLAAVVLDNNIPDCDHE